MNDQDCQGLVPLRHRSYTTVVILLFFHTFFFLLSAAPSQSTERVFQAGAATADITPPLGSLIVGGWRPVPAAHIHDPLMARCLVLDDGQTRVAIVVVDSVAVPRHVFDRAKRLINEATGLSTKNMLMSATHTHSGPNPWSEPERADLFWGYLSLSTELTDYQKFMAERIADGVRSALNNLEPAKIGWGVARAPEHVFSRRWFLRSGVLLPNPHGGYDEVQMNPGVGNADLVRAAGPTDPEVSFISVQSRQGRPIALLANYSLHYVGGVSQGEISADYFGIFASKIAEIIGARKLDPPFVGIMSNGTSGDINNINWGSKAEPRRYPPYRKMEIVASSVAADVYQEYLTLEYQEWVPLRMVEREIEMKMRVPSPEQLEYARQIMNKPDSEPKHHSQEQTYAEMMLGIADYPESIPFPLQAVAIGDLGIAAIPGEVFAETGLELKRRSPFLQTFTISLANGSYGYIPTPEQHQLGGYETWLGVNRIEIRATNKIVATLLDMFQELSSLVRE
ncbi:MAG TPA: neutral/alkaline non-lysosomal ceramidase N-terminal domain-containing protein [Acidobacteriota bacterium]|nr:neutral/alkaline non-lysosomal ceramidase N-terminal domain-containing protein [Acidobacteriota bacterium]